MTDDEKRQQKGMLLLEYQEAKAELANLKERRHRLAQSVHSIAVWLGYGTYRPQEYESLDRNLRDHPEYVKSAMNAEEIINVMQEVRSAEQKLKDLAARKTALGLE